MVVGGVAAQHAEPPILHVRLHVPLIVLPHGLVESHALPVVDAVDESEERKAYA